MMQVPAHCTEALPWRAHAMHGAQGAGCTCEAESKVHHGATSEREESAVVHIWEADVGNPAGEVRPQAGGYWQLVRAVVRYVRLQSASPRVRNVTAKWSTIATCCAVRVFAGVSMLHTVQ